MSAIETILSIAEKLISTTESSVFKEISFIFSYKSELEKLNNTVSTVRAVLLDAQSKEEHVGLSNEPRLYMERLKYAVYDADDLLDKFTTLAHQKKHLNGGKFSKEVRAFFSNLNQLGVAYSMSRGIKEIRKTLDAITSDHARYGIGQANYVPIVRRNKETCSWVNEKDIVGRDDDKEVVIDMLRDPNVEGDVSFVTIVGVGGLGKTALAQLVYNDKVVESEFPLRMWVCVSDQDPKHLDIKAVLCKILAATGENAMGSELERVQQQLRKVLEGKKYLLVLDDVWTEDRNQCRELGGYLMGGAKGSRIMVTTRSKVVAQVIGNDLPPHELQGLSKVDSWNLFKRLAFKQGQTDLDPDLVKIGEEIVEECANVPLAIRMMGTLLYGKSKMEWQTIQRKAISKIGQDGDITHVLKLSYYHLDTHLKSCFSYCAVFPKDYVMDKMELISLWMAQGYLEPLDESQSLINAGEECFSILLGRCFFQDVETDGYDEIMSCKMHDLMHDIAQEVAGKEICNAYCITSNINKQARHVFGVGEECAESSFPPTKIRTYIRDRYYWRSSPKDALLRNWKYLRALDLHSVGIKELPCAIGKLLHLRYLDLSRNGGLKRLPKEITKLHNMQTLLLSDCSGLKELPGDVSKLVKLNVLEIEGCSSLRYMPWGLDRLSGLCILPLFVVGGVKLSKQKHGIGKLEDIAMLDLKGKLRIEIRSNVKGNDKGGFLKRKENLNEIELQWLQDDNDENKIVSDKEIAEELQPNSNLKRLRVRGYGDMEKPSWAIDDKLQTSLPNLVFLTIEKCKGLEDLPMLGRLQFLKSLDINDLMNLEYMEKGCSSSYGGDEASSGTGFFPSLETLKLKFLPKMKGWWRGDGHMDDERSHMSISFPCLSTLWMQNCPLLTSMPLCPTIKDLILWDCNERLKIMKEEIKRERKGGGGVEDQDVYTPQYKLSTVDTEDVGYLLKSLPMPAAFQSLSYLLISGDEKMENLREVENIFRSCSSSLQYLHIKECRKLRSISGALDHLTALQHLKLYIHSDIMKDEMIRSRLEEEDEVPWSALQNCLHTLAINYMPTGIRHLTSLRTLTLHHSSHVKAIPEWITSLTSLQNLEIWNSSQELCQRCKSPDGLDWPKIQHIPKFYIQ